MLHMSEVIYYREKGTGFCEPSSSLFLSSPGQGAAGNVILYANLTCPSPINGRVLISSPSKCRMDFDFRKKLQFLDHLQLFVLI